MRRFVTIVVIFILFGMFFGNKAFATSVADELKISPAIMDLKMKKGEFAKNQIVVENLSKKTAVFYPFVYHVDGQGEQILIDDAGAPIDRAASLGKWLDFPRSAIEFFKGKEMRHELNLLIKVSPYAKPAIYHAVIAFARGGDRDAAKRNLKDAATVMLNVEIVDDGVERLSLKQFIPDRLFVTGGKVNFKYNLENNGDYDLVPTGEIRIYDRRGKEITAVPINKSRQNIESSKTAQLASVWSAVSGFGRYKALLDLNYGEKGLGSVQDTIFIWVISWKYIFLISLIFLIMCGVAIRILLKASRKGKDMIARRIKVIDIQSIQKNNNDKTF